MVCLPLGESQFCTGNFWLVKLSTIFPSDMIWPFFSYTTCTIKYLFARVTCLAYYSDIYWHVHLGWHLGDSRVKSADIPGHMMLHQNKVFCILLHLWGAWHLSVFTQNSLINSKVFEEKMPKTNIWTIFSHFERTILIYIE